MYEKVDALSTLGGLTTILLGVYIKDFWCILSGAMLISVGYPGTYLFKRLRTSDDTAEVEK